MGQQVWIFRFRDEPTEAFLQANLFRDLLLDASSDLEVTEKGGDGSTQGSVIPEIVASIMGTTGLAGILLALTQLMKSRRVNNVEITKIITRKDGSSEKTGVKVSNISDENYRYTLDKFLKDE